MPEYVTTKQAATLAAVHRRTIYRARLAGTLPAVQVGDVHMFERADLDRWITDRSPKQ